MAITVLEYLLMRALRERSVLPLGADVLEIGEAEWYGDVGVGDLKGDIKRFAPPAQGEELLRRLEQIQATLPPQHAFDIAKVTWDTFLQPRSMTAIDLNPARPALKLDLNEPVDLGRRFHLVMNLGTLEHVFNLAQAFKTIHDHTEPGGFMIHGLPFTGWIDHGFYNFQPTFHWDLAEANGYEVVTLLYGEVSPPKLVRIRRREDIAGLARDGRLGGNGLIYSVLRKGPQTTPFRIPMQGYYAGRVTDEVSTAWRTLR